MVRIFLAVVACLWVSHAAAQYKFKRQEFFYAKEHTKGVQWANHLNHYPFYWEEYGNVTRKNASNETFRSFAPGMHDFMHFIPAKTDTDTAYLVVSHELKKLKKTHKGVLGEGGAVAIIPIYNNDFSLNAEREVRMVNFAPVGWTAENCGGGALPNGNVFTAEEIFDSFSSTEKLNTPDTLFSVNHPEAGYQDGYYTIPKDYPEFGGRKIPLHMNFGYIVEIDVKNAVALHKCYHMGRFSHESAVVMPDNRTVYLTDDHAPACLFKFVADKAGDFRAGNLFAYGHWYPDFEIDPTTNIGWWIPIPRDLDSLMDARNIAIRKGATLFMRLEWAVLNPNTGKIYIAETGKDSISLKAFTDARGKIHPAAHWHDIRCNIWDSQSNILDHPYGSILELDVSDAYNPQLKLLLNGGNSKDKSYNAASFDGLTYARIGNRDWLIIHEDLIDVTRGRMPEGIPYEVPDAFFLDLNIPYPKVDDLHRFFLGARKSETAGATFTPDGQTLFINHQHAASFDKKGNETGKNYSATLALHGWGNHLAGIPKTETDPKEVIVHQNEVFGTLHFNQIIDLKVSDEKNNIIFTQRRRDFIKLAHLPKGRYIVRAENLNLEWTVDVE